MIHHVSLGTNDLEKAKAFYDAVMAELGLRFIKKSERILAYELTEVLFSLERPVDGKTARPGNGTHVAFHAGHRNTVDACHRAGIAGPTTEPLASGPNTTHITTPHSCATPMETK